MPRRVADATGKTAPRRAPTAGEDGGRRLRRGLERFGGAVRSKLLGADRRYGLGWSARLGRGRRELGRPLLRSLGRGELAAFRPWRTGLAILAVAPALAAAAVAVAAAPALAQAFPPPGRPPPLPPP